LLADTTFSETVSVKCEEAAKSGRDGGLGANVGVAWLLLMLLERDRSKKLKPDTEPGKVDERDNVGGLDIDFPDRPLTFSCSDISRLTFTEGNSVNDCEASFLTGSASLIPPPRRAFLWNSAASSKSVATRFLLGLGERKSGRNWATSESDVESAGLGVCGGDGSACTFASRPPHNVIAYILNSSLSCSLWSDSGVASVDKDRVRIPCTSRWVTRSQELW
jgi:hypothetical protein